MATDSITATSARPPGGDTGCKELQAYRLQLDLIRENDCIRLQNLIHDGDIDCVVDVGAMPLPHALNGLLMRCFSAPSSCRGSGHALLRLPTLSITLLRLQ